MPSPVASMICVIWADAAEAAQMVTSSRIAVGAGGRRIGAGSRELR